MIKPSRIQELTSIATSLGIEALLINRDTYILERIVVPHDPMAIRMDKLEWMDSRKDVHLVRNMSDKRILNIVKHLYASERPLNSIYYYMRVDNWIRVLRMELEVRKAQKEREQALLEYAKLSLQKKILDKNCMNLTQSQMYTYCMVDNQLRIIQSVITARY